MRTDWRRGESMSALTMMNMSMHEEAMIPKLASPSAPFNPR